MDGLCLFSLMTATGPGDRKTANKTTKPHKPNVISFYYSLFDSICFVLYFFTFLGGAHTGTHVSALRTGSCARESHNGINFTV